MNSVESCDASANDDVVGIPSMEDTTKNILEPEMPLAEGGKAEVLKLSDNNALYLGSASSIPVESGTEPSSSQKFQVDESVDQYSTLMKSSDQRSSENIKKSILRDRVKSKKPELHVSGDNRTRNLSLTETDASRDHNLVDKVHDIDIYGIVDPLELARQVAIEVQREVVESRDQSCSSSEKHPEENESSPNSGSAGQSKNSQGSLNGAGDTDLSDETSLMREESSSGIENPEAVQANEVHEMENSLVTEVSQEANTEKALCGFDLNQELSSEDVDGPADHLLPPVSVVSASEEVATPGAVASLPFDGIPGWKGSAATSAFLPMFQKFPESDKDISTSRSVTNPNQRQESLEIDLNAVEMNDGKIGAMLADKKIPTFSGISSGECSMETRCERFSLDLNCFSDDSTRPPDLHIGQFPGEGSYSKSHAAPTKQPSLMSFDLNDQPSFRSDLSDHSSLKKPLQPLKVPGGIKADEFISIMGARVKVNRNEFGSPSSSISSMQKPELSFDIVNMGRGGSFLGTGSVLPYNRFPGYNYQNIAPGPAMPFTPTMYPPGGPIPYMVDSRGAPVIPQIISPATTLPTGFSQIPLFMNMPPSQGPSNGLSPLRGNFDGGSMVDAGGRRDPAGFTQFLNLGSVPPTEEPSRSNSLSFSSFVTGKRKEPESAWEPYPFKHHTPPPWK